jgi:hypothetical protein
MLWEVNGCGAAMQGAALFRFLGFGGLQLRIRFPAALLAHRLATQLNAIGIVDQPIHNAVGDASMASQ